MPFNASGIYSLPSSYLATPATTILSNQQHNTPFEDIQSALSQTLLRDGRAPVTGDLLFAAGKTASLGRDGAGNEAMRASQLPTAIRSELGASEASVASASTVNLGATSSLNVLVTGTTAITSLGTVANAYRRVRFSDVLTLTHNATSLVLPGGANITTAAGDIAEFMSDAGGNWRCVNYQYATGGGTGVAGVTQYGVSGGASDEATAMQAAISGAAASGLVLDLEGLTIRIDSSITLPSNAIIQNGAIDFRNAATGDTVFETGGSDGAFQSIGSLSRGASTINVVDGTAFAAKDLVWISSADVFGFSASTKGEWQRVRSVSSNTLNLYGRLRDSYATTVRIFKPAMKRNITLRNLRVIGGGDAQAAIGVALRYVTDFAVEGCVFDDVADRCIEVRRAAFGRINGNTMRFADENTGLAYGAALVNGCEAVTVAGNTCEDLRHGVTIGGEDGVDRFITVMNNAMTRMADSGIDTHPNTSHVTLIGNTLDSGHFTTDPDANRNGITCQGAHSIVANNVVREAKGIGIHLQPLTAEADDTLICTANIIESGETNTIGIFLDNQKIGGALRGSTIANNVVRLASTGTRGITVEATASGGTLDGLSIAGNRIYSRLYAVRLFAAASKVLQDVAITGNSLRVIDATEACVQLSNTTAGAFLTSVSVSGNTIRGGSHGVRSDAGANVADRVLTTGNTIQGWGTAATSGAMTSANNLTV